MGGLGFIIFFFLKADQQSACMSVSSAPPMGGDGFFYYVLFLIRPRPSINRRNSFLFEIGSSYFTFLPVLDPLVYKNLQKVLIPFRLFYIIA